MVAAGRARRSASLPTGGASPDDDERYLPPAKGGPRGCRQRERCAHQQVGRGAEAPAATTEPWAIRPPALLFVRAESAADKRRAARPPGTTGPAARPMSGTPRTGSPTPSSIHPPAGPVTTTPPPQPKTKTPTPHPPEPKTNPPPSSPAPADLAGLDPAARIPAVSDAPEVTTSPQSIPAGPPALLVEHVTKRFVVSRKKPPVLAIDNVSLRLERGEIHGILGANGSGKSTLIRLVSGLLTLDTGRVEVFGLDLERDELAVKRLINRVSVDAAFFKKLSPMENLLFAARLYGLDGRDAKRRATEILARLGIGESRMGRPVEQMSQGMQQKVAIARALLTSPTLLLLDEPTTGLDPRSKLDVQTFVEEVRDEHGASIVLTTHDLAEAERLCDRIALLNDGRVVALDTPTRLKTQVVERHRRLETLENVFMTYPGKSLDDDVEEAADATDSD